jgi:hypothetical protein
MVAAMIPLSDTSDIWIVDAKGAGDSLFSRPRRFVYLLVGEDK